jgi:hypothetical protein
MAPSVHEWEFPLPRTHTGMLQGNAVLGTMIWGEGGVLRVTVGRADFWDRRGGIRWNAEMNFATIRACLERGDQDTLWRIFQVGDPAPGQPKYPSILPVGRIELDFGTARLTRGTLDMADGTVTVYLNAGGTEHAVTLALDMDSPVLAIRLPDGLAPVVRSVPAWEYVGEYLQSISFTPPRLLDGALGGWVQVRPADGPLCVGYARAGSELHLTAVYGEEADAAAALAGVAFANVQARAAAWWHAYWAQTPRVTIPNDRLQFLYDYGMYKFGGLTNPAGVPATLQGPWIEEYQMPPWSSDYHFNINVQMCYWPAYHGNLLAHLQPLFRMVDGWTETLRHNARVFLGLEDGRMLPHAVDDRGVTIGGFWAGSLDHGCTAWVAQMMFRYYRYTMDAGFLRDTAYPFMQGALRVYQGMLEDDGQRLTLPVSVSPEYVTKETRSPWGRNASFQFACLHRLCEDLIDAAAALGDTPDPAWQAILDRAPKACLHGGEGQAQIAIWEGTPLEESHRHHSHLAGITPFDIFDLDDPAWAPVIARSLDAWIYHGPGLWSGWCVPWAAMLHQRFGQGGASELLLESWERVFTNSGHGTLHDADIPGFTLFGQGYANKHTFAGRNEVMQIEAGMAATTAIQEMLLHTRRGVTHVFPAVPKRWRRARFAGMRTDGAFLVSAERDDWRTVRVTVESPCGGPLRLANPWSAVRVTRGGATEILTGAVLELPTTAGDVLVLEAAEERA